MKRFKRLFYYLLINVFVSLCTTLTVLQLWAWRQPAGSDYAGPLGAALTQAAGAQGAAASDRPATTAGILIITQLVTAPPEAFTPYPTRGIVSYRVKEGDTLSGIAQYFGVNLDDLMALNDLRDANRVISGIDLLIPAPSTETPTLPPQPTKTATITLTPRPSLTPQFTLTPTGPTPTPAALIQAVFGVGDLTAERVAIKLSGDELSLFNWQLSDEDGHRFTFPQLTLRAGGEISVYSKAGDPSINALYWGSSKAIWQSGEMVTLTDAAGNVRATFRAP